MSFLKTKKSKVIFFSVFGAILVSTIAVSTTMLILSRIDYVLSENPIYEINTENPVSSLFSEIKIGTLKDPDLLLDTKNIGEKSQKVTIVSQLGTETVLDVIYNVNDTIPPTITGDEELSFIAGDEVDILGKFAAEDNSNQEVALSIDGEYDLAKAGEYIINIVAEDQSGNKTPKQVTIKIAEPPHQAVTHPTSSGAPYYIEVNRQQNVVIVYSKDQNGNYSNIAKVFVASTGAPGSETPLGTFTTSDRYESLYLVGNVWGHYTVRISGPFFFHSVPYFTKGAPWDNLEYLEYNKLGSGASAGCVRLAAADAKWVYDNIGYGTTVKIYDSDTLPAGVVKPTAIKIDEIAKIGAGTLRTQILPTPGAKLTYPGRHKIA